LAWALIQVIEDLAMTTGSGNERPFFEFLESSPEAEGGHGDAGGGADGDGAERATARELAPAVTVLQHFLNSPKPVLRFAAIRTLNKVLPVLCLFSGMAVHTFVFL